jgi:hypothetical protein
MRRNPTPAITPQLYRHFATVTIILTAATAFFANGEKDQAAAADASQSRAAARAHLIQAPKPAFKVSSGAEDESAGTWGSDENDGFGRPTMQNPANSAWTSQPLARGRDDALRREGSDDSEVPSKAAPETVGPTAAQIAAATAASRLRSGSASSD